MKVFLEISIGNKAEYQQKIDQHSLFLEFFNKQHSILGLKDPSNLTEEEKELVLETFDSLPDFKSRGPILIDKPKSIVAGRLVIDLFADSCPKTVKNFVALCNGGTWSKLDKKKQLYYKGCKMHRLVNGFIVQGGDVLRGDGSSGDSIYNGKFNDEKKGLAMKFEKGTVAMANSGKNSNTSQFFISLTNDAAALNSKYVVFGKIVDGLHVLDLIDSVKAVNEKPSIDIEISDCGQLNE